MVIDLEEESAAVWSLVGLLAVWWEIYQAIPQVTSDILHFCNPARS